MRAYAPPGSCYNQDLSIHPISPDTAGSSRLEVARHRLPAGLAAQEAGGLGRTEPRLAAHRGVSPALAWVCARPLRDHYLARSAPSGCPGSGHHRPGCALGSGPPLERHRHSPVAPHGPVHDQPVHEVGADSHFPDHLPRSRRRPLWSPSSRLGSESPRPGHHLFRAPTPSLRESASQLRQRTSRTRNRAQYRTRLVPWRGPGSTSTEPRAPPL